ncbi:MAG TPA: heme ABC exporter ATP-binding protein CcmA [Actinobacteria bacterium]|nr:heme ABC exporter ATP-binding protein CcmA [Actinomycetota bacterium]
MRPVEPLVRLDALRVDVGSTPILRDLDLVVESGETVGLFGANGAGKTTVLRVVATLRRPSAGTARVLGVDVASDARFEVRRRIGYVGHLPGLYPDLTLAENLGFAAEVLGLPADRVGEVLAQVGLAGAADRLASACSHGMQRRAEFARQLLVEPELLLLDEPHSALDVDAVDLVEGLVARVVERGGGAILVSHDRDRVAKLADRCVELVDGRLR